MNLQKKKGQNTQTLYSVHIHKEYKLYSLPHTVHEYFLIDHMEEQDSNNYLQGRKFTNFCISGRNRKMLNKLTND